MSITSITSIGSVKSDAWIFRRLFAQVRAFTDERLVRMIEDLEPIARNGHTGSVIFYAGLCSYASIRFDLDEAKIAAHKLGSATMIRLAHEYRQMCK